MRAVGSDPANTPLHHTKIDADKRYEEATPTTALDPTFDWFVLGFAYCLVRIDRSLFEVFQAAGNLTLPLKTHRSQGQLASVIGADLSGNSWMYIVQGVPKAYTQRFMDFVASYRFVRRDTAEDWCCTFQAVRIHDPFSGDRSVSEVWYALPHNLTRGRRLTLMNEATRLLLQTPEFGMARDV